MSQDWWNSTTYHTYYRKWNVVVHDWLFTYIYKDMYEIVMPRNRTLAATTVFFVSAIFHEYMLAFAFRFFYPVMFILFGGLGFSLFFVRKIVSSNILMWLSWCLGNGVMFSLYSMEFYARRNCSPYSNYYLDLFIPRSWTCQFDAWFAYSHWQIWNFFVDSMYPRALVSGYSRRLLCTSLRN